MAFLRKVAITVAITFLGKVEVAITKKCSEPNSSIGQYLTIYKYNKIGISLIILTTSCRIFAKIYAKPSSLIAITMPMDDIILKIAFWSWRHEELKFTTIDRYTSLLPCLTLQIEQNKAAL